MSNVPTLNLQVEGFFRLKATPNSFRRLQDLLQQLNVNQTPTAIDEGRGNAGTKDYVHIHLRKGLTTVLGLKKHFSYNEILKDLKKKCCCNGDVVQHPKLGRVIQLQGDQVKNVRAHLVRDGIVKKEHIKTHGV